MVSPIFVLNNKNNIVILSGETQSFRCRQRAKDSNGLKVKPLRFISYKDAIRKLKNNKKFYGPVDFYTISKL